MGGLFRFESNSRSLLALAEQAFARLPAHELTEPAPRLSVRLCLTAGRARSTSGTPPPMQMFSGQGFLGGAIDASNMAIAYPAQHLALILVSRDMLRYPYHVRYELIEFVVYLLAARVQRLVPLHAAAVGMGGRALLLIGSSQTGKSTVALHCLLNGMELLSEDAVFVAPDGLLATGIANFLHVQADALRFIHEDRVAAWIRRSPIIRRRSGARKFEVDLRRSAYRLAAAPLRIDGVVLLSKERAGARRLLVPLPKRDLLRRLAMLQSYAAQQQGWRRFGAKLGALKGYQLLRGSHPRESVEALRELFAPATRRAPHT